MSSSQDTIDQLQKSLDKIDKILAALNNGNGGGTPGNGTPITPPGTTPGTAIQTFASTNNGGSGGSGSNGNFSTSNGTKMPCITPNCTPVNDAITASPSWAAVDPKLQPVVLGIGKVASQMQGSSTLAKDAISGAGLSGAPSALNKAIKTAQSAINSQLKKLGQSPVDFKGAQDNLLKDFNKATSDALQKSSMTPSQMLASMGMSGVSNGTGNALDATKEGASKAFAKNKLTTAAPVANFAVDKMPSFNPNDKPSLAKAPEAANVGKATDQYEMDHGDISKDQGANIFSLISERYMKSALPKLLDKKVIEEKK